MSRRIRSSALQATNGATVDTYFDRIIKYIPADIVSAWVAVIGIVKAANGIPTNIVLWIAFFIGASLTFVWTLKQTHMDGTPPAWLQALVSTVAFGIWAFALGAPFDSLSFYNPVYGSLALIAFTLASGRIVP
jgi:hypothetical protein